MREKFTAIHQKKVFQDHLEIKYFLILELLLLIIKELCPQVDKNSTSFFYKTVLPFYLLHSRRQCSIVGVLHLESKDLGSSSCSVLEICMFTWNVFFYTQPLLMVPICIRQFNYWSKINIIKGIVWHTSNCQDDNCTKVETAVCHRFFYPFFVFVFDIRETIQK